MRTPLILVNFKTYRKGTGRSAMEVAKECEKAQGNVAVSPQFSDLRKMSEGVDIPVLSQHVDPVGYGSNTGHVLPEAVKESGAVGTLLNHSERRLPKETIGDAIERCREVGLETVVCVQSPGEAATVAGTGPDCIAYEPPELIGGDVSVSKARPEVIKSAVKEVESVDGDIDLLVGAGVNTARDVEKAMEMGAGGVLVASGVLKSEDPGETVSELSRALRT